ncbi:MAG: hypothetical protein Q9157_004228 [Trypethelium eluteriae]
MVAWGIITTLIGIVQNYEGLLAARIFLGIAEAGLFSGVGTRDMMFKSDKQFSSALPVLQGLSADYWHSKQSFPNRLSTELMLAVAYRSWTVLRD